MQIPAELQSVAAAFCHAPEAAVISGLPLRSFHKYVKEGLIPCYKIGRHRLFKKDELVDAIQKCRIGTVAEVLS
jgi:excisionase family DNA binding protein